MRILLLCSLLCLLSLPLPAAPRELLKTSFGNDVTPVPSKQGVTGSLPAGWRDNSGGHAKISLDYRPMIEGGQTFLRVTKLTTVGRGELATTLGPLAEAGYFRLELTARNRRHVPLEVGVRRVDALQKFLWITRPTPGDDWQTDHYTFHLDASKKPVGIWITFSEQAEFDLRELRLRQFSRDDLIAEMRTAHPGADTGNLVRNSRFPLGMQSGWAISREVSDGDVLTLVPDPDVIGPSGAPALRITTPVLTQIYTAPVAIPWSFLPHTASLSLCGEGGGSLVITGDGHVLARKPFKLHGRVWQRIALTFTPVFLGEIHSVRLDVRGKVWMDALQVEAGSVANPYASPQPREVALALPKSDASAAGVQFDDEHPFVSYCVTGTTPGVLRARVVNVYGREQMLTAVAIGADFRQDGMFRYDVFPDQPYGPLRIEAWVEDAHGLRISPPNELVLHRLHRPRYWGQDAPDSPFGVHALSCTRTLLMAKAIGANWVRLHDAGTQYIGWCYLEPEKGQWAFRDQEIQRYRTYHLKILGMLSTAPGWATKWQQPTTQESITRYLVPLQMADFANYVRRVTTRYRGVIDSYEVWNEPWGSNYLNVDFDATKGDNFKAHFIRSATPEADYRSLMHTAYTTAKAVDPGFCILGINTTAGNSGHQWSQGMLQNGGLADCDALSYHHYSDRFNGSPRDNTMEGYANATGAFRQADGTLPKPVWMSEGNAFHDGLNFGMYHYTTLELPQDDNIGTANRLARYLLSHRALNEAHTFLYSMHAHNYFEPTPPAWSALITAEGYLHPCADAHAALAWLLEDTKFVKLVTLARGVHAYFFQGQRGTVAVLSTEPSHADFTVPQATGIAVTDLFGNPIRTAIPLQDRLVYLSTTGNLPAVEQVLEAAGNS